MISCLFCNQTFTLDLITYLYSWYDVMRIVLSLLNLPPKTHSICLLKRKHQTVLSCKVFYKIPKQYSSKLPSKNEKILKNYVSRTNKQTLRDDN